MKLRSKGYAALAAGASLVGAVLFSTALAQQPVSQDEIRTAFAAADENRDDHLNVDEFVAHTVHLFRGADANRDSYLVQAEVPRVKPERFKNADRDGDSRLSIGEAVGAKMIQFFDLDTSHDGAVSLEEVLVYERTLTAATRK